MFKSKEIRISPLDRTSHARPVGPTDVSSPHGRLLRLGPKALSPGEILSLVMGPGGAAAPAATAAVLLDRHGGLGALARLDAALLCRERGVGPARAVRLAAAFELGARAGAEVRDTGPLVRGPADLVPLLEEAFRGCDREHFLALHLDARHRVTRVETVSVGCLDASLVHPREVFRGAVARGAAALIVAHNHPSGCAEPSRDDLELTARLAGCGRLLGIELLDHIVMGRGEHTSLREHGWPTEDRHSAPPPAARRR
ncbi:MAG: DNA repair protein RadC [bacterium]|nr:DNA repair protein RadC [bacterium]